MKEDEIVWPCDRHSIETVALSQLVTKYKNMRNWMVQFLRKFKNVQLKLVEILDLITKIYQFSYSFSFCMVLGVRCDVDIFKLTASAQSIYREFYNIYLYIWTEFKWLNFFFKFKNISVECVFFLINTFLIYTSKRLI